MLKTILIVIVIIVVLRWVARLIFRSFLFKVAQQMQEPNQGGFKSRTYNFGGNPFQQANGPQHGQQKGQQNPKNTNNQHTKPNPDKLGGEYIDFEEVK